MSSQALNKRLNAVKSQIPVTVNLKKKQLSNLLGYLDTLAQGYRDYNAAQNLDEALPKQNRNQNLK